MSPDKFAKRIDWYAKNFERNTGDLLNTTALTVHSVVVLATPVDTGRARGNWLVNLGGPADGTVDNPAEFDFVASMGKAQAKLGKGQNKDRQDVHITNNLPYIQRLNEGWSRQAPAGFVEASIAAGTKHVQGAKLLNPRSVVIGDGR